MKIILQEIEWDNWFSYGANNKLTITEQPLTQVKGLNGEGKSSIPLIIQEILYGKNSKGIKKQNIQNRERPNESISAKMVLFKNSDKYEIKIQRKSTIKLQLLKNGEDISSHTSTDTFKTIEEIIGIDFKTFCQLTYQSSTSSLEFLTATDTQRKKFLVNLFNLEQYIEIHEKFKEAYKEQQKEVASIEGTVKTISKWITEHSKINTDILETKIAPATPSKAITELGFLKEELKNIESTNSKINKNNQYKDLLESLNKEELTNIVEKPESKDQYIKQKTILESEINNLEKAYNKFEKLGKVCPTCEQDLDEEKVANLLDYYNTEVVERTATIDLLNEKIEEIKKLEKKYNNHLKVVSDFEKYMNYIDATIPADTLDADDLKIKINSLENEISKVTKEIKEIVDFNNKVEAQNSKSILILEQLANYQKQLEQESLALIEQKNISAYLVILRDSFGTNGLVSYKIESLIKELESQINEYLTELSSGRFQINFYLKEDKLNIEIIDNGVAVEVECLSTGELARVNTATLLAIRKLLSNISSTHINLLFLDEVAGVLDIEGKDTLINVLLNEDLNTYFVDHTFSHPLVPFITVQKENNISRINYG